MFHDQTSTLPAYEQDITGPVQNFPARDERTVTLFMLGRLWHQNSDTICRIRNISSGGMRVETAVPLQVGEKVSLETRSGIYLDGQVAWTRDLAAGIRFADTIDHGTLLATPAGRPGKARTVRAPRFPAAVRATMRVDGWRSKVRVVNISLSGCAVLASTTPPHGSVGELTIAGLRPLKFAPRWTQDGLAGLTFLEKLGFGELAHWLGKPEMRFMLEGGKVPEDHTR